MTTFDDFRTAAPELAAAVEARLTATGLAFLGTIRRDGSPRISPFEPVLFDGRLFHGSMPEAAKAKDLQRDGRCVIISSLADKDDRSPEAKLFCTASEIRDPGRIAAVLTAAMAGTEYEHEFGPDDLDGSHVFELSIDAAAVQQVTDDCWVTRSWKPGTAVRVRRRIGASGLSEDTTEDAIAAHASAVSDTPSDI